VLRSQRLLALPLVLALSVGDFAWSIALLMVPVGAYDVALQNGEGRLEITLDRRAPADRRPRDHDPATELDGLHDEYVVTLTTLDACSTTDTGTAAKISAPGPVAFVTHTWDAGHGAAPPACPASSRAGPPLPASAFTILRI
jgi:hypothetical protein